MGAIFLYKYSMSSYDRISGDYHLTTLSGLCGPGDIHFTANAGQGSMFVNGNLIVLGTYNSYQTVNTTTIDRFLTLGNNTPIGYPSLDGGIKLERGPGKSTVMIKWTESIGKWQLTNDGVTFANIHGKDPVLSRIEEDLLPRLGSHLNTQGYRIFSPFGNNIIFSPGFDGVGATSGIAIERINDATVVPYLIDSSLIYAKSIKSGGSGIYITDNKNRSEELITKRQAVIYSLVL